MNLQDVLAELRKHNRSILTVAAVGAELRLREQRGRVDDQVRSLLRSHDALHLRQRYQAEKH